MVVGLGAAGGLAVLPLAQAGLGVVGLEAGNWMNKHDFSPDELRNNVRGWPHAVQKANNEVPTHRPNASTPTGPRPRLHPMMNAVGGTTLHYLARIWRLSPWDFKVVTETKRRYGAGRIPKGSTVEDWPLGYDDLEPYYEKVEYELGVSGKAGNLKGKIDPPATSSKRRAAANIQCRLCAAPSSPRRWRPPPVARLAPVHRCGRDQLANLPEPRGLHVPRFLQPRRLPRRREGVHRRDDDPEGAEDGPFRCCAAGACDDDRG